MYIKNRSIISALVILSIIALTAFPAAPAYSESIAQEELANSENLSGVAKGALTVLALRMMYNRITRSPDERPENGDETNGSNGVTPVKLYGETIVIDPGHGGWDPGAIGPTGLTENEVVMDISNRLYNMLNENTAANVYMTRYSDIGLSLSRRAEIARNHNADIFISVHNNGFGSPSANGIETYTHNTNALRSTYSLASSVQNRMVSALNLRDRGVKTANFSVLRNTRNMKSILVEIGFITNPHEESLLRQSSYRQKAAQAIYDGILDYYN